MVEQKTDAESQRRTDGRPSAEGVGSSVQHACAFTNEGRTHERTHGRTNEQTLCKTELLTFVQQYNPGLPAQHTHTHPRGLGSESHFAQLPPFIARKLLPMGARERDLIISLL